MQTATWTYARVKTVPLAARASMLGVFICPNPYALISGRMSSMAIISTFRRAWAEAMDAQSNSVDSDMVRCRAPGAPGESFSANARKLSDAGEAWAPPRPVTPPPAGADGEEGKEAHPRNRCVVITLGSANVRIGRAGDRTPVQVPCTIAYRTPTKPTPSARGAEAQSTAQAQRRDAERAALEASYRKRHRVLNGIEYSDRNALTTMPADPNHWFEYTDKDRVIVG